VTALKYRRSNSRLRKPTALPLLRVEVLRVPLLQAEVLQAEETA
jgi:hypothetical protein